MIQKKYIILILCILSIIGCTSIEREYEEFLPESNILYPGKIDSLQVLTGYERVQLKFIVSADPNVKSMRVYYNARAEFKDFTINDDEKGKYKIIELSLPEKTDRYLFEVFTYNTLNPDESKYVSVPTQVQGKVYGERFKNEITPRYIINKTVKDSILTVDWGYTLAKYFDVIVDLSYESKTGETKHVMVERGKDDTNKTIITDFAGTSFDYVTRVVPDELSIDTINSVPKNVDLSDIIQENP